MTYTLWAKSSCTLLVISFYAFSVCLLLPEMIMTFCQIFLKVMLIFIGKRNSSWNKKSERECHMRMNSMQSVRSFCNSWNWSSFVSMQSLEQ